MSAAPSPPLFSVLLGNIGNVLEWYDFVVFAFLAPVIGARAKGRARMRKSSSSSHAPLTIDA
jgi:hypothetical protein